MEVWTAVAHVALIVAVVAHGMHLLARVEARRLRRLLDARRRTVVVTITADTSSYRAALADARAKLDRLPIHPA